jgi:hypothetical protein
MRRRTCGQHIDEHASVGSTDKVSRVITDEEDVVEVQPPLTPFQ